MKKFFECEEVTTIVVTLDLGDDLNKYMDKWLALCNHCREDDSILQVRNFYGSNLVEVTYLVDDEDLDKVVIDAGEHAGQFGKVTETEIKSATLIYRNRWNDENYFLYDE